MTTATAAKNPGHRYLPGHPHYPRKQGSKAQSSLYQQRTRRLLNAIVAERGGELSVTQMLHARNAAALGAAIAELNDAKRAGKFVDVVSFSNLVNAQRRSLAALDE